MKANLMNRNFIFLSVLFSVWGGASHANDAFKTQVLSCLLEPSQRVEMSSEAPGVVKILGAERGDFVAKGQVLLRIEDSNEQAALKIAKERNEFVKRKLERNEPLIKGGVLSAVESDDLMTELNLSALQVEELMTRLAKTTTTSPISGVVVKRHVSIGQYVKPDALIFSLAHLDTLHAEVVVRSSAYGSVKIGELFSLSVQGSQSPVKASVSAIDRVIDAASGTFGVRLRVPNGDRRIAAGVKCSVL